MSGQTAIEWTDRTWNPLTGCTKVSPGCDHCYAKTMHERFNGPGSFDTVTLHPDRLDQPLRWRKPARVFVNSMSDLFHDSVPDEYIAGVFAVMALAPRHTFQVLTKRHARLRSLLKSPGFWQSVGPLMSDIVGAPTQIDKARALPNVWLGVSVENQQWADIRIPALLDTPAAVRFLSCEPLLGPVDLRPEWMHSWLCPMRDGGVLCACIEDDARIDWVIVGGESGHGSRPMEPAWPLDLMHQCKSAGVPFLFKQWGEWAPVATGTLGDYEMKRVGKKTAGRRLGGRTWDEYPATVAG